MSAPPGLVLHAPTADALRRARRNLPNFRARLPDTPVEIVVNAAAVALALDEPDPGTDGSLVVCENSLRGLGREAPAGLRTVAAAVVHLHERQLGGWTYVRA